LAVSKWQAPEMNQLLAGVAKRLAFFGCKLVKNFGVETGESHFTFFYLPLFFPHSFWGV